ncbi:hypothetical protein GCM10022226_58240 [Sphaerisporangium flaviroseum]|uniref:Outer membrane channel protein CpnT-like N-terminal domain-containing protein n=1 Tax=Sphaerisporangium flaviroseum TaxID=509199 RepID=A0ABP7IXU0_9ACTN
MGVTLPPWADGILDLAGVPWPNIDEDEIRKDARAWRTVLAASAPAAEGADRTVLRQTSGDYQGTSATALANHWRQTGGDGHLSQAAGAGRFAPVVLEGAADVVTGTKVAVISQASVSAVKLATTLLAGGPLAIGTATATVLATRYAMGKILREAGEGGARVLAPGLARRVTEPLARILRNSRGPWGGGPSLAGAGGPARIPIGHNPLTGAGGGPPRGGLKLDMGRGGGKRYGKQTAPRLSKQEQEELAKKAAGEPYDRRVVTKAERKLKQGEKFEGDRNEQKRQGNNKSQ